MIRTMFAICELVQLGFEWVSQRGKHRRYRRVKDRVSVSRVSIYRNLSLYNLTEHIYDYETIQCVHDVPFVYRPGSTAFHE